MYRPSGLKDQNNNTDVNNVVYNAANQLTSISYLGINESRTYNTLNQLTGLSATQGSTVIVNKSYSYPAAANIGKITSQTDNISGEVVQYTYDSLNRLLQASTSAGSPAWSQAFTYDPYGNLTAKTGTGGAPAIPTSAQPSSYDANGNVTTTYGNQYRYDVENRLAIWDYTINNGLTNASYAYDTQNRRVWQWNGAVDSNGTPVSYSVYYYGPNGQRLGAYTLNVGANTTNGHITGYTLGVGTSTLDTYFGGRRLAPMDRLASAAKVGNQSVSFYPYGEDKGTAGANDSWKFATYWRDSANGLDYAMDRYYSSGAGRFLTPDPYVNSAGPSDPQSWNRYAYTRNDPINRIDPSGLDDCEPSPGVDFCVTGTGSAPSPAPDPWGSGSFIFNEQYLAYFTGSWNSMNGGANGSSGNPILISKLSTTSKMAIAVQNDLRWLEQAIAQNADCAKWLQGSSGAINYMLDVPGTGATMMAVGVGSFSGNGINAVAGITGTNLPTGMLITVNLNGAFFNSGPSTSVGFGVPSWITAGSYAAQALILLHELAHDLNAAGFNQNDSGNSDAQKANNGLVLQNCGDVVKQAGGQN